MSITHEKVDEIERQLKDALDDLKASQPRDADRLRLLLTSVTALRAGLVLDRNKAGEAS